MEVNPQVPAKTVAEFIAYAKANPGKIAYASAGPGSTNHLSAALLEKMAGIQMLHVPYKGGAPAVTDTVGGQVQMFVTAGTQSLPHVKAGKLKLLAVTESRRSSLLKDVPTVAETVPGYEMAVWYGCFGPKGMPADLQKRLNAEINAIMMSPDVKAKMEAMAVEPVNETPERFGEIAAEFGGGPFTWTTRAEERTKLWEARHHAALSNFALRPGAAMIATDVCVPISRLADCVEETRADAAAHGILAPIVGHVGDGNFHAMPLIDVADPDEVAAGQAFVDRLVARALAAGGTSTGEHGIGQSGRRYLAAECDAAALGLMQAVKHALDPRNIMNPGKVLPEVRAGAGEGGRG